MLSLPDHELNRYMYMEYMQLLESVTSVKVTKRISVFC